MSLIRLVYYSTLIGGCAAYLGWLLAELCFFRSRAGGGYAQVAMVGGIVGAAIGIGLNLVAGMANGHWKQLLYRSVPGLLAGGVGGAVGGVVGDLLFSSLGFPRAIGWMIVGLSIGMADGLFEHSPVKLRNGLIGGSIGGLIGGFLFDPIQNLIHSVAGQALMASSSGMSSRATAFVILGMCIGALIGLVQVVLKEAWLTVLDGYRAGRQLILSQPVTTLGRGDHLPLPFLGPKSYELEVEHLKIARQPGGAFVLEDNQSKLGTQVNGQPVRGPVVLKDRDVIKLGANHVRFNERARRATAAAPAPVTKAPAQLLTAPPPPPKKSTPPAPLPPTSTAAIDKPVASRSDAAPLSAPPPPKPKSPPVAKPSGLSPGPQPRVPPPPPPRKS